ncbi:putative aliphatic sulfonates-binding protein [Podospora conica]|nr:putative aliphatic sulfonates-binding protein [Schizothecium conicum]
MKPPLLALASLLLPSPAATLRLNVTANQAWIEHTPLAYTNQFSPLYHNAPGPRRNATTVLPVLAEGGVATLSSSNRSLLVIGANAETQGLKQYATHKNYRLIYVLASVPYRLVARRASGIRPGHLGDLRNKTIATFKGSSAEVFVRTLLADVAGLKDDDYTLVSGNMCMREPCAENSLPERLKRGEVDAFGCWETAPELAIQGMGEGAVAVFQNGTVYREVFSLYATAEALRDKKQRAEVVRYLKAVGETLEVFKKEPERAWKFVGGLLKLPEAVLRNVWADHIWGPGSLGKDLVDYLEKEDEYLARVDKRPRMSRKELEKFVDASAYEESLKL